MVSAPHLPYIHYELTQANSICTALRFFMVDYAMWLQDHVESKSQTKLCNTYRPSPGDLPDPVIEPGSPRLQEDSELPGKPQ